MRDYSVGKFFDLLGGKFVGIDGEFADTFAVGGAGIESGEAGEWRQCVGGGGLRESVGGLKAEHFWVAGQVRESDCVSAEHRAGGVGREHCVVAGQLQCASAAGAVDDGFYLDPVLDLDGCDAG